MNATGRRLDLDVLRIACLLYIVGFWHLCEYSPALGFVYAPWVSLVTVAALSVFVFLSGYLLSLRYAVAGGGDALRLYRRRFLSVYPMYLIALVVFVALRLAPWRDAAMSAALLGMLSGRALPTLWFMDMLLVLYLATPLFLFKYRAWKTLLLTGAAEAALLAAHYGAGLVDTRLVLYLPSFALGIIVGRSPRLGAAGASPLVLLVALVVFAGCLALVGDGLDQMAEGAILEATAISAVPLLLALARTVAPVIGRSAPARNTVGWLSAAGFALYLFHRAFFKIGVRLYAPETLGPAVAYLVGIVLPTAIVGSYIIQRIYDRITRPAPSRS